MNNAKANFIHSIFGVVQALSNSRKLYRLVSSAK